MDMDEKSSPSLKIVAETRVDPVCPYLFADYSLLSLLQRRLSALEVALPDISLNVALEDGRTVKTITAAMQGLQNRVRQRGKQIHEFGAQCRPRDAGVEDF